MKTTTRRQRYAELCRRRASADKHGILRSQHIEKISIYRAWTGCSLTDAFEFFRQNLDKYPTLKGIIK